MLRRGTACMYVLESENAWRVASCRRINNAPTRRRRRVETKEDIHAIKWTQSTSTVSPLQNPSSSHILQCRDPCGI